jgi:hypothetical protein
VLHRLVVISIPRVADPVTACSFLEAKGNWLAAIVFSGREAPLPIHCLLLSEAATIQARLDSRVALLRQIRLNVSRS